MASQTPLNPQNGPKSSTNKRDQNARAFVRGPSSSTEGFFQSPPIVLNQLEDDIAFQRALGLFIPSDIDRDINAELYEFGDFVISREVLNLVADAEKNLPYLKTWDTWAKRRDDLITSEGWRKLSNIGAEHGMVAIGHENKYFQFSRPFHFLKYILWSASSAWTVCPNLMTDGVAYMLRNHLSSQTLSPPERIAFHSAYNHLVSRDPDYAWSTGQWMTERQGGSDVSQTETLASLCPSPITESGLSRATDNVPLGPWSISGFKWFSSATDCNCMVFLARTQQGISTFYAPMRRMLPNGPDVLGCESELNGIQIQRLKQKLGTRALPTAELVLKDVRAYLVGEEGNGVKEIAAVLNVARLHNAAAAVGFWARGLSIARAFSRSRKVGLKPLWTKSSFMRTLSRMHKEYKANVLFTVFVASLLGIVEQPIVDKFHGCNIVHKVEPTVSLPQPESAELILRLLTPVLKGLTAKNAIAGLAECMECLGGVGYLENEDMQYNIARLYRDVNVCSIWEGTTDMMAHDVTRVIYGKTSHQVMKAMDEWVNAVGRVDGPLKAPAMVILQWWNDWQSFVQNRDKGEIEMRAREVMERLGNVVMGILMLADARRDADQTAIVALESWVGERQSDSCRLDQNVSWEAQAVRDVHLVFGTGTPEEPRRNTSKL